MALAWKAGWVNALRGSNPLSSAIDQFQNTLAMTVSPLWALPVIGVSDTASCGEAAPAIARGSIHHLTPNFLCALFKPIARFVKVLDHGVEWRAFVGQNSSNGPLPILIHGP